MIFLETERLIIRSFTMDDLDELYRLVYADQRVKDAWSGQKGTPEELKARFAQKHIQRADELGFKAVVRKDGKRLLGLMGFQRYEPDEDTSWLIFEHEPPRWRHPGLIEAELTYALGYEHWGRGYATEAGKAMIEYGFNELGIARIVNSVMGSNAHSINLMRRLGFRLQKNLSAKYDPPAVVGILENERITATGLVNRPYAGETDMQAMIALVSLRPPDRITEYPSIVDLQELLSQAEICTHTRLWEDMDGHLIGFAIFNSAYSSFFFEIAPSFANSLVVEQVLTWGIERWRQFPQDDEPLQVSCRDHDTDRVALLERHGFVRGTECALHYAHSLSEPIPLPQMPEGFTIRPVLGENEVERLVALHRAAFGTENLTAEERLTWMRTPEYKPELDLLTVAPDGTLAAYVMCQISEQENALSGRQVGYTDPVATHPAFQRRGLARALLLAGLRLLRERGMDWAELGTSSENVAMQKAAESAGFCKQYKTFFFVKPMEVIR